MNLLAATVGLLVLLAGIATPASARDTPPDALPDRDARLLTAAIAELPPQRPGVIDLYAIGVAGDANEDVFRNEVRYFDTLMRQRLHARGTLALINHVDSLEAVPAPLATYENLRDALAGVASRMDPQEDLLFLYLTMHGTPDHELVLDFPSAVEDVLIPQDLRELLDASGIRNRVVVLSACYSGGFIPALRNADTLVITAARADRTSFGCGADSSVTWFGRAWMVEGLNRDIGPIAAYQYATGRVRAWEKAEKLDASHPQIAAGRRIKKTLGNWQAQLQPGEPVPYPYPLDPR